MGEMHKWCVPFRYVMGLDDVTLKPNSPSRAWQDKQRVVTGLDRIAAAVGSMEHSHRRIAAAKIKRRPFA